MMKRELVAFVLMIVLGAALMSAVSKKKPAVSTPQTIVENSPMPASPVPVVNATTAGAGASKAVHVSSSIEDLHQRADLKSFERLEACLDEESGCAVDETEPLSRHLWVVQQTLEQLQAIRLGYLSLPEDQRSALRADLARLSRWALAFPDDNVREEGLRLARLSLDGEEIVSATVSALSESISGPLYSQGLDILKQAWTEGDAKRDIENFLILTLDRGGFAAGEEIAGKVLPFLDKDNVDRFKRLAKRLPPESNEAVFLSENIREFERLQSGG